MGSSPAQGGLQVERVLDDLIHRLQNSENGPEVRAALIEARRLKNVAARWGAIPPPPDARREMLARVMDLAESVTASPRREPVTGPHKPFVPSPAGSPKPFPARPSREVANADTLSPPPPRSWKPPAMSASPSIRSMDDMEEDVQVPRPAPVPNIEQRGKPLTLRPPSSQPFAPAESASPAQGEKAPPIKAVAVRGEALDGLSSTISSSKLRAPSRPSSLPPLPPRSSPAPRTTSKPPVLSSNPTPHPPSPGDVSLAIADGVTLVRPASAEWQPHPLWKGTSVKLLSHDPEKGEYTALVRLSQGSSLPPRRHVSVEEMWMVQGVAHVGELEMNAGDYSRGDVGSIHPRIVSTGGCTFLLRANENDEILSAPTAPGGR